MNYFFFVNVCVSLIIFNVAYQIFKVDLGVYSYVIIACFIGLIVAHAWLRGRYALVVKNEQLRINNFPLSYRIRCSDIQSVKVSHKKVEIKTLDERTRTFHFFAGPVGVVHPSVNKESLARSWEV